MSTQENAREVFKNNLNRYMELRGIDQAYIVSQLGITASTVSDWVNGKKYPRVDAMQRLADLLRVSLASLTTNAEPAFSLPADLLPLSRRRIPVLGSIAAGTPIAAAREYDEYVSVAGDMHRADAALRVEGDSMAPRYLPGDLVLIRLQEDVDDGQVAAVCVDDSVTLKHVYHLQNGAQLISDNPKYPPMIYTADNSDSIRIMGLAVGFIRWES